VAGLDSVQIGSWRARHAEAAEADVELVGRWLQLTDELLERFEDDETVRGELNAVCGLIRSRRDDRQEFGRLMRARET
jgi:hypothetical protein